MKIYKNIYPPQNIQVKYFTLYDLANRWMVISVKN